MRIVGLTLSLFAALAILHTSGPRAEPPPIESVLRLSDQTTLFYRQWTPGDPKIVVLGVHGFNDHSKAFAPLARALVERRQAVVYAYDQRGFGANTRPGVWAGEDRLVDDLREVAQEVKQRHPGLPLVVVGESMGGAVVLRASTERPGLTADRIILKAAAIWGAEAMPWYQRASLQWFNAIAPDFTFTGRGIQSLGIRPTDDPAVSRDLSLDPLFIKETRVSSLYGVTQLMGQALNHPIEFPVPTLVLYGLKDKIIPPQPTCYWLTRLVSIPSQSPANLRFIVYPNGWHMLTRQLEAKRVIRDIEAWIGGGESVQEATPMLETEEARAVVCR